jgi:hypothetical protein
MQEVHRKRYTTLWRYWVRSVVWYKSGALDAMEKADQLHSFDCLVQSILSSSSHSFFTYQLRPAVH